MTDDFDYVTRSIELDADTGDLFTARDVRIIETDVKEVVYDDGTLAGSHINALPAVADTGTALAAVQKPTG